MAGFRAGRFRRTARRGYEAWLSRDELRVIGAGTVGMHAGDVIGEVALALEMHADAVYIAKPIHPHPILGESIGMAAEPVLGGSTDPPPQRRTR